MSQRQNSPTTSTRPPTADVLRHPLHNWLNGIMGVCLGGPAPASLAQTLPSCCEERSRELKTVNLGCRDERGDN
jgi:hypothetical protein